MKKFILTLAAILLAGGAALSFAQGPQGGTPGTPPGGYWMGCCGGPMHGRMMRGMGMHRGWMGQGMMMGRGWMRGNWMGACPWDDLAYTPSGQIAEPLTEARAQAMAEHLMGSMMGRGMMGGKLIAFLKTL